MLGFLKDRPAQSPELHITESLYRGTEETSAPKTPPISKSLDITAKKNSQ